VNKQEKELLKQALEKIIEKTKKGEVVWSIDQAAKERHCVSYILYIGKIEVPYVTHCNGMSFKIYIGGMNSHTVYLTIEKGWNRTEFASYELFCGLLQSLFETVDGLIRVPMEAERKRRQQAKEAGLVTQLAKAVD